MAKLSKYFHLSPLERKLYIRAAFMLLWIRLVLLFLPFKKYAKNLGIKDLETPDTDLVECEPYILQVKDSIRRASRYNILKPKCLAEAIVAKKFLNRKNIPSTLYLGVAKDERQKMIAHAWLRSGNIIVTGRKGMDRFTVVSKFS